MHRLLLFHCAMFNSGFALARSSFSIHFKYFLLTRSVNSCKVLKSVLVLCCLINCSGYCMLSLIPTVRLSTTIATRIMRSVKIANSTTTAQMSKTMETPAKAYQIFTPKVPLIDDRHYEAFLTSNGVRVLLISDPSADKCAAAMNAGIGSFGEPFPGTAHLLEHLLNTNSKKFPKLNTFSKYLDSHGGSYNAMTSDDCTIYYFDIIPSFLYNGLEIFLDTFISPLLSEVAVAAEIEAVDHEFQKNIGSDTFRIYDFVNSRMSTKHPMSKFSIGNKYTLKSLIEEAGLNTRDVVKAFYEAQYSSNRMSLAVIGKDDIDSMKSIITPWVEQIPNRNLSRKVFSPHDPLDGACRGKLYKVVPVADINRLVIVFSIDDLSNHYRSNVLRHIDYYLDKVDDGSFNSYLQRKGWGNGMTMKEITTVRGTYVVSFMVDLSSEGVEHYEKIVGLVYKYLNLIATGGGDEMWRLCQHKRQSEIEFDLRDRFEPIEHVSRVVQTMDKVDYEDFESADTLIQDVDPKLFKKVMVSLKPASCSLFVFSKKFSDECNQTDKWYGIRYCESAIQGIEHWEREMDDPKVDENTTFALPHPNMYIPSTLDMTPDDTVPINKHPVTIVQSDKFTTWYKKDIQYKQPRILMRLIQKLPIPSLNINDAILFDIYRNVLNFAVERELSDAFEAYYRARIEGGSFATLKCEGFTEKINEFIDQTFELAYSHRIYSIEQTYFELARDIVKRKYKSMEFSNQRIQASRELMRLMGIIKYNNVSELLESIDQVNYQYFQENCSNLFRKGRAHLLIVGDVNIQGASELSDITRHHLDKLFQELPTMEDEELTQEFVLPRGCNYRRSVVNKAHPANGILVRLQCGRSYIPEYIKASLINEIINEDFFDDLRTRQNLGYLASSYFSTNSQSAYLTFYVQSDCDCGYVDGRIETFIAAIRDKVSNLSSEEFEQQKQSLKSKILKHPESLGDLVDTYSVEVEIEHFIYDRRLQEAQHLEALTKEDVIAFCDKYLFMNSYERRKMAIYVTPDSSVCVDGSCGGESDVSTDDMEHDDGSGDEKTFLKVRKAACSDMNLLEEGIRSYIESADEIINADDFVKQAQRLSWKLRK
ncbi:hypothetical protein ACOME3_009715 [Neoechinorhynchus agilis]